MLSPPLSPSAPTPLPDREEGAPRVRLLARGGERSDGQPRMYSALSSPPVAREVAIRMEVPEPLPDRELPAPAGKWYSLEEADEALPPIGPTAGELAERVRPFNTLRFCLCRTVGYLAALFAVLALFAVSELFRLQRCAHGQGDCFALELVEVGGLCSHEVDYLVRARVRNPLSLSVHMGDLSLSVRRVGATDDLAYTRLVLAASMNGGPLETRVPPGLSDVQAGPAKLLLGELDALSAVASQISNGSSLALEAFVSIDATVAWLSFSRQIPLHIECEHGRCATALAKEAPPKWVYSVGFELRALTVGDEAMGAAGGGEEGEGAPRAVDSLAVAISGLLAFRRTPTDASAPVANAARRAHSLSSDGALANASVVVHLPRVDAHVVWQPDRKSGGGSRGPGVAAGEAGRSGFAPYQMPLLAARLDAQTMVLRLADAELPLHARAWVPHLATSGAALAQRASAAAAAIALLSGQVDSSLESGRLHLVGAGARFVSSGDDEAGDVIFDADEQQGALVSLGRGRGRGGGRGGDAAPSAQSGDVPAAEPDSAPSAAQSTCMLQYILDSLHPVALTASAAKQAQAAAALAASAQAPTGNSAVSLVDGSAVIDLTAMVKKADHKKRFERVRASLLHAHPSGTGMDLQLEMWLAQMPAGIRIRGTFPAVSTEVRLAGVRIATVRLESTSWPRQASEALQLRLSVTIGDLSVLAARIAHALRTHGAAARRELALSLSGLDDATSDFAANALSGVRLVVWRLGSRALRDPVGALQRKERLASDEQFYKLARWWEPSFRADSWSVLHTRADAVTFNMAMPYTATPPIFEMNVGAPHVRFLDGVKPVLICSTMAGQFALPTPIANNLTIELTSQVSLALQTMIHGAKLPLSVQIEWTAPDGGLPQRVSLPLEMPDLRTDAAGGEADEPAVHLPVDPAVDEHAEKSVPGGTWQVLAGKPKIIWGSMMSTLLFWEEGVSFDMQLPLHNPLNFAVEVKRVSLSATFNDPDGASTFAPDSAVPLVDALVIENLQFRLEPNQTALSPKISIGLHAREVETLTRVINEVSDHQRLCGNIMGTVTIALRVGNDAPFEMEQPFSSPHVSLYGKDDHVCDFTLDTCEELFAPALRWPAAAPLPASFDPFGPLERLLSGPGTAARPASVFAATAEGASWLRYATGGQAYDLHVDVINASSVPLADPHDTPADPFVLASVGCDGKQCNACTHCIGTSVVQNAESAEWRERLHFGIVSAEQSVTLRLMDYDSQFAQKLLLARTIEPPWPPSGALIEVRSTSRYGERPMHLFARLGYVPAVVPEPSDGARLLHDGAEKLVVTHLTEQPVRVSEGFHVRFQVKALANAAAVELKTAGLDPVAHPIPAEGGTRAPAAGGPKVKLSTSNNDWAPFRPAPAFSLLVYSGAAASADELVGHKCGSTACPGCAGIKSSICLTFDHRTVRLYVDGMPTYQRAGQSQVPLDDGNAHTISVRFDVARKQLAVSVDDAQVPALHEQMTASVLERLEGDGGYARVGITAGSGEEETRPLVLEALAVSAASASPPASVIAPSPADGYVGRVGHPCEFTLRPRTACGLPALFVRTWRVHAQATTSAMDGSVPRGRMLEATAAAELPSAGASPHTAHTMRFVPTLAGIHRILVSEGGESGRQYDVGEVLVLQ
mmetsp:Transcript_25421/g.62857  ORF Transcript_25421/g.62857 Transcript_25421/m.62857 type:complete len:1653 (+) Transcript_25421:98-5056(+)